MPAEKVPTLPRAKRFHTSEGWASDSGRFPGDQLLRRHGFVLLDRPDGEPAWWRDPDDKLPVRENEALLKANALEVGS